MCLSFYGGAPAPGTPVVPTPLPIYPSGGQQLPIKTLAARQQPTNTTILHLSCTMMARDNYIITTIAAAIREYI